MDWKKQLKDNGLTITELADRMLVTRQTVYNWFDSTHKSVPDVRQVIKLSRYLGIALGKLIDYFNNKER